MDGNNMNNVNEVVEPVVETVAEPVNEAVDATYSYNAVESSYDYASYDADVAKPESNGLALASMILGIVAIVLFFLLICCSPLVGGIIATPVSIVGLILGIKAKKKEQSKGMWLTGIICSVIALVIGVGVILVFLVSLLATVFLGASVPMLEMMESTY